MLATPKLSKREIIELRRNHLSPSLSLSYSSTIKNGLHIIRGKDQYLFDSDGNKYLDCRNNVQHIGHSNDIITECVTKQISLLNTNTRYLHENIVLYAKELTSLLPSPLNYATFVNSGTEANEFALRISTSYTKRKHIIAFEHGYHGNTTSTINVSHYKLVDQPSQSLPIPSNTHFLSIPDMYHGIHLTDKNFNPNDYSDEDKVCDYYIKKLSQLIDKIDPLRNKIAAFIGETVIGCGGQVFLPKLFLLKLKTLFINKYGNKNRPLIIVDEVQCGFGRLGYPYYWAFQHNTNSIDLFIPDIITLGKSIGNGFPLSCTVTNKEILIGFKKNNFNQEYFNTFGGNPVSMIVGLNVLNIIKKNKYLKHVKLVGDYFINLLIQLQRKVNRSNDGNVYIGDIRGKGLFIGIELVKDLKHKYPATHKTEVIVNRLAQKPYCLLLSTDGPFENVIKIKPPICFTKSNAETVVQFLEDVIFDRTLFHSTSKL
eukprot:366372_1